MTTSIAFAVWASSITHVCLIEAMKVEDFPKAVQLLQSSAFHHINAQDDAGQTALHLAAREGNYEICCLIVNHHGFRSCQALTHPDAKPPSQSALRVAAFAKDKGHKAKIMEVLLEHANARLVNLQDSKGNTCLHYACSSGSPSTVQALLSRGCCDLELKNFKQPSPQKLHSRTHVWLMAF